ncbi:MAG: peptide chain release factor N(5)-glutamine methyltransferase [bacterium]
MSAMKISQLNQKGADLMDKAGIGSESEALLAGVLGIDKTELYTGSENFVSQEDEKEYLTKVEERMSGVPLAYILGYKDFYNMRFAVNKSTLIPRPETELIVDMVREIASVFKDRRLKIIDIGTGCGNIIISVSEFIKNADYFATDISLEALNIAKVNAKNCGEANSISLVNTDVFGSFKKDLKFDIILSNPPYVPNRDFGELQAEVLNEPVCALSGGSDGLDVIRSLISGAKIHLVCGGYLLFEIGFNQRAGVYNLLKNEGFTEIMFLKDIQSIERVAVCRNFS